MHYTLLRSSNVTRELILGRQTSARLTSPGYSPRATKHLSFMTPRNVIPDHQTSAVHGDIHRYCTDKYHTCTYALVSAGAKNGFSPRGNITLEILVGFDNCTSQICCDCSKNLVVRSRALRTSSSTKLGDQSNHGRRSNCILSNPTMELISG